MAKIVVIGSCSVDYATYALRLPLPGETIHGDKFTTSYGGKGANQAVAAAKLSGNVSMIARVGDDTWGEKYIKNMASVGIDVTKMKISQNRQTGIAQIMVSESGENQIVIVKGANEDLSIADVEASKDIITSASVLVAQLETPVETTLRAFQLCQGVKILNAAPAMENLSAELLSLTTVLCVNEPEASLLTGITINSIKDAVPALAKLLSYGCKIVIVTLGADGALYASKTDPTPVHVTCSKVTATDTTGAGDAFIGALAVLLSAEPPVDFERAIRAACFAASASVVEEGTQTSFLRIPYAELLKKSFESGEIA